MKIEIEIPDDVIVREGVLVISGWLEDGGTFWKCYPLEETPQIAMSDLCRRAHLHLEGLIAGQRRI